MSESLLIVIITFVLFFVVVPGVFMFALYLEEEEKISKTGRNAIIGGLILMPIVYSTFTMGKDCGVFIVAYTFLMLLTFGVAGLIKLFRKH